MTNQTAVRFGYPDTLVREYDHWLVLLREPQATLGSLVLCEKSDATEFSAISAEDQQWYQPTAMEDVFRLVRRFWRTITFRQARKRRRDRRGNSRV